MFTCAILNAQPMGFYSPATLIDDAKRHGVEVLPVDVQESEWDCTLEVLGAADASFERTSAGAYNSRSQRRRPGSEKRIGGTPEIQREVEDQRYAVRVGLRYIKGLREDIGRKIVEARGRGGPFESIAEFARRTGVEEATLSKLAEAGAFERFQYHRRNVLWEVSGIAHGADRVAEPRLPLEENETEVSFDPLNPFETIGWDYHATGHSTRGHLLTPLRDELRSLGLPDARAVSKMRHGRRVRYAGIVINRQRPGTAKGVVFMTLEDETGFVNLIVWRKVFQQFEILAKTASFLGVTGKLQSEAGVVHLVAEALWDPALERKPQRKRSRDFH